jgi:hypothetical protein
MSLAQVSKKIKKIKIGFETRNVLIYALSTTILKWKKAIRANCDLICRRAISRLQASALGQSIEPPSHSIPISVELM